MGDNLYAPKQTGAEICLAAYEALAPVLKALVSMFSPQHLDTIRENDKFLLPKVEGAPLLDSLALLFLQNVNNLLTVGVLARTRRAVLMNWKVMDLSYFKLLLIIALVFISFCIPKTVCHRIWNWNGNKSGNMTILF